MSGNATLLIDLENFFLGRESNFTKARPGAPYDFPADLESLYNFADAFARPRRLAVRRAYANFNVWRPTPDRRREYYLQELPSHLMGKGIEPVQVFRFPGGGNKNAADMRLAMDATALIATRPRAEQFIIVTGDSDFIPLVLELKRCGAEVVVIGVEGSTKAVFARYCDRFEYFEELLAAQEIEAGSGAGLLPVRDALQALLARAQPVRFAAVKPLLSAALDRPFDPSRYDCGTTGDFLRRYAVELGIAVRRGEHDWEIGLPSADEPPGVQPPGPDASGDHTAARYRDLLQRGTPRIHLVPFEHWLSITDHAFRLAAGAGERPTVFYRDLLREITALCAQEGMDGADRRVNAALFQVFKAGCFLCADGEAEPNQTDFNWARAARLDPSLTSPDALRQRTHGFLVQLLAERLEQAGVAGGLRPDLLAELLFGPEPPADLAEGLRRLAAGPADGNPGPEADTALPPVIPSHVELA